MWQAIKNKSIYNKLTDDDLTVFLDQLAKSAYFSDNSVLKEVTPQRH
jgi:hypothetical protein